jgi:hypothetical protein
MFQNLIYPAHQFNHVYRFRNVIVAARVQCALAVTTKACAVNAIIGIFVHESGLIKSAALLHLSRERSIKIKSGFLLDGSVHTIAATHGKKCVIPVTLHKEVHKFISIHVIFDEENSVFGHPRLIR